MWKQSMPLLIKEILKVQFASMCLMLDWNCEFNSMFGLQNWSGKRNTYYDVWSAELKFHGILIPTVLGIIFRYEKIGIDILKLLEYGIGGQTIKIPSIDPFNYKNIILLINYLYFN